jgi:hypothetical protein
LTNGLLIVGHGTKDQVDLRFKRERKHVESSRSMKRAEDESKEEEEDKEKAE